MNRRVVSGLVGMVLAGCAQASQGQSSPARDPSSQPPVGLSPIPSINDSINNTGPYSRTLPIPSAGAPTSPVGSGPAATIPRAPVLSEPVSMTPIEPIHQSINNEGPRGSWVASIFRRRKSQTVVAPAPPRVEVTRMSYTQTAASEFPDLIRTGPRPALPASPLPPNGRRAPFAEQVPDQPRRQAVTNPGVGRPAPLAQEIPNAPRPKVSVEGRPSEPQPRPKAEAANPPVYRPAESPAPVVEPVALPPVEPIVVPPEVVPPTGPVPIVPPPLDPVPTEPPPIEPPANPPPMLDPVPPATPPVESPPAAPPVELPAIPPVEPPTVPPVEPPSGAPPAIDAVAVSAVAIEPPPGPDPLPLPVSASPVIEPPPGPDPLPTVAKPPELSPTPAGPEPAPAPPTQAVSNPPQSDPALQRTNGRDEAAIRTKSTRTKDLPYASLRAAAVGDEIITMNELSFAVEDRIREAMGGMSEVPPAQKRAIMNQVAASVLNNLIDQSLILHEAKSRLGKTNDKALQQFNETIDKVWVAEEVPPLCRQYTVTNVFELKQKLAEVGKSYDDMKSAYRKKTLSNEFLRNEIRPKLSLDLSEQRAYYNAHLADFMQPERMTWREIEINVGRYPSRPAARKKAEEVLTRLLRDESFETLAKAVSNGPTASKGGLYVDMQPGSYGIPVVNDELNKIPTGQVSQILEAPASFFIIRVDSRREKGPLRLDEVQEQVRQKVFQQSFEKAITEYLAKLRAKTLIRTMFDNTASDPVMARRNDPAVRRASNTAP